MSEIQAQFSWFLCSGSQKAATKVLAGIVGSFEAQGFMWLLPELISFHCTTHRI